jgi:DNA-binding response OmpR family regulator
LRFAIVEDLESLQLLYTSIVEGAAHQVLFVARTGEAIVDAVADRKVGELDGLIIDYRLTGMTGLEAAVKVVRYRPRLHVVVVSADDTIENDVLSAGFYYLRKPFSMTGFLKMLREPLARETAIDDRRTQP